MKLKVCVTFNTLIRYSIIFEFSRNYNLISLKIIFLHNLFKKIINLLFVINVQLYVLKLTVKMLNLLFVYHRTDV